MGRGAHGPERGDLHAVGVDGRTHALQSRGGRHRERASRSRDRRARRSDGNCDRRDRDSVQAAEPKSRPGRVVTAGPGRQTPLQRVGAPRARPGTEHRMDRWSRRPHPGRQRRRCRARARERRNVQLPRTGRDDRDVSERAGSHRPRAAAIGASGRAAIARAGGVDQVHRLHVGAPQDRDAAEARSSKHRFLGVRTGARRRPAGAVLVYDRSHRARSDRLPPAAHDRARSRSRAAAHRRVAAVQRSDQRHRAAVLSVARGQSHAVRASRAASVVSRARGPRCGRDLHQRLSR